MNNTVVVRSGLSLTSVLTIIFVIAKLCGAITWSWWLVFCPLWIGLALWLTVVVGLLVFAAGCFLVALVATLLS